MHAAETAPFSRQTPLVVAVQYIVSVSHSNCAVQAWSTCLNGAQVPVVEPVGRLQKCPFAQRRSGPHTAPAIPGRTQTFAGLQNKSHLQLRVLSHAPFRSTRGMQRFATHCRPRAHSGFMFGVHVWFSDRSSWRGAQRLLMQAPLRQPRVMVLPANGAHDCPIATSAVHTPLNEYAFSTQRASPLAG